MNKRIALFLILALLLCVSGCGQQPATNPQTTQPAVEDTLPDYHFSKMEYIRPDPQTVLSAQEACETAAQSGDWEQLRAAVAAYLDQYNHFCTMSQLANIHYSLDLSDADWEAENDYCAVESVSVMAGYEQLGYALAATEFVDQLESDELYGKNGLLYYKGENYLTEELEALLQQEANLQNQYYVLTEGVSSLANAPLDELGELLAQLVLLRQNIAAAAGYNSYADYAYDRLFHRDYTPDQAQSYLDQVRTEIAPILAGSQSSGKVAFAADTALEYLGTMTQNAGGVLAETFELLETGGLYDIAYGSNKMNAGFCRYLPDYQVPYIFVNSRGADAAVGLTHEFGHFCDGYAGKGLLRNVDAAEIYSQGMEYMSMFYADGTLSDIERYGLLNVYVVSAAQADFELQMYALPPEEVTADRLVKLYVQVGSDWGLTYVGGFDKPSLLMTLHYYLSPMYMLSYAVSGDAALQLYELEMQEAGAGLACYEKLLDSQQVRLLSLLEEAELRSPFEPGAIEKSRDTFTQMMKQ